MKLNQTIEFYIKTTALALSRMYNKVAAEYGITQTMGYVLMYVAREGTPSVQLAWQLGMQDSSLTRLLKNMENKNLISKLKDQDDKRIVRIFLTPEGIKKRKIIKELVLKFNQSIVDQFNENELDIFYRILDKINKLV